jgi:hypothetical protein
MCGLGSVRTRRSRRTSTSVGPAPARWPASGTVNSQGPQTYRPTSAAENMRFAGAWESHMRLLRSPPNAKTQGCVGRARHQPLPLDEVVLIPMRNLFLTSQGSPDMRLRRVVDRGNLVVRTLALLLATLHTHRTAAKEAGRHEPDALSCHGAHPANPTDRPAKARIDHRWRSERPEIADA